MTQQELDRLTKETIEAVKVSNDNIERELRKMDVLIDTLRVQFPEVAARIPRRV
jgi:alanine dehydrogenase